MRWRCGGGESSRFYTIENKTAVTIRDTSMLVPDRFDPVSDSLISLSMKDCRLRSVPSTFCNMLKLRSIALSHNYLENIPAELFRSCANLESVVLNNNLLQTLPSIRNLKRLRTLWIGCNFLTELPDGTTDLTCLQDICVNNNRLIKLPDRLERLGHSLWTLNAAKNKIRDIPRSIGKLSKLRHLDLQRNEIAGELPEELGELVSLVSMWKLSEDTAKIAKEKIDEREARRSTIAISRDAFVSAAGLRVDN